MADTYFSALLTPVQACHRPYICSTPRSKIKKRVSGGAAEAGTGGMAACRGSSCFSLHPSSGGRWKGARGLWSQLSLGGAQQQWAANTALPAIQPGRNRSLAPGLPRPPRCQNQHSVERGKHEALFGQRWHHVGMSKGPNRQPEVWGGLRFKV